MAVKCGSPNAEHLDCHLAQKGQVQLTGYEHEVYSTLATMALDYFNFSKTPPMRRLLALFPIVFFLASCGDRSKIEDLVRQNLKDPESAQFKDTIFSSDNKRACIVWNAKNSMGGYGDWDVAELKKENSKWVVKDMKSGEQNCSETGFKALDAGEKAELNARLKAIEILQKVKNISSTEAIELGTSGKCRGIVWNYAYNSKNVAEYQIRNDSDKLVLYEKDLVIARAKLDSGDCESFSHEINPILTQSTLTENIKTGSQHIRIETALDSWIAVVDGEGSRFSELVRAGEEQNLFGVPPFKLVVGEAAHVKLTYNGNSIDLTPYIGQKVARLTLE